MTSSTKNNNTRTFVTINKQPLCLTDCPEILRDLLNMSTAKQVSINQNIAFIIQGKTYLVEFFTENSSTWRNFYLRKKLLDAIDFLENEKQYKPASIFSEDAAVDLLAILMNKPINSFFIKGRMLWAQNTRNEVWYMCVHTPYLCISVFNDDGTVLDSTQYKASDSCYNYAFGDSIIKDTK